MDNHEGCVQMSQQSRRLPLEASTSHRTEALQHLAERKKRDHLLVILAGFDKANLRQHRGLSYPCADHRGVGGTKGPLPRPSRTR